MQLKDGNLIEKTDHINGLAIGSLSTIAPLTTCSLVSERRYPSLDSADLVFWDSTFDSRKGGEFRLSPLQTPGGW